MSSLRVVLVSQRVDEYPARNETRDALDQRLVGFLLLAGLVAIPVPNLPDPDRYLTALMAAIKPSGVVLSGGNDVGECPTRDVTEAALLRLARCHHLPALGICRGMQFMAHDAGAELMVKQGHVRTRHVLKLSGGSGPWPAQVNSFHGQVISRCPEGFFVCARSEDDQIEAMRNDELSWEGWMWHPEREEHVDPVDLLRVRKLFGV